jgi:ribosome-binding protein aMBF1 (putative translation factor)
MRCSDCNGEKEIKIFPKLSKKTGKVICTLPCDRCNGTGTVPKEMKEWMRLGEYLRNKRREEGLTLRAFSEKIGVDALIISKAERGIMDPVAFANLAFDGIFNKARMSENGNGQSQ